MLPERGAVRRPFPDWNENPRIDRKERDRRRDQSTNRDKRLKSLENENAKLKKLLAEHMLDASALRELWQEMVGSVAKREAVAHLQAVMDLSERRACQIVNADRKTVRYLSRKPPKRELRAKLRDLANERRRFGYRRLFVLLRRDG